MMRKMVLVLVILLISSGLAFAQWSVGLESGVGILTNDVLGADELNRVVIPVMGTVYYRLPATVEVPNLGETVFDVGANIGWMRVYSGSIDNLFTDGTDQYSLDFASSTVPILFVGEAKAGPWFAKLGLGLHAWFLSYDSDVPGFDAALFDDNGLDIATTAAIGYRMALSEALELKLGLQAYSLGYDGEDADDGARIINLLAGIQYAF